MAFIAGLMVVVPAFLFMACGWLFLVGFAVVAAVVSFRSGEWVEAVGYGLVGCMFTGAGLLFWAMVAERTIQMFWL
jgi:hypothetical protein